MWPRPRSLPPPTRFRPRVADVQPDTYIIGVDDVLAINVWKEPEMSKAVPVRPDGMISLPLVGEIKAVGLTPVQLQDQITASLKKFMSDPQVTVIVTAGQQPELQHRGPGYEAGILIRSPARMTVLDAIALCGGFQRFRQAEENLRASDRPMESRNGCMFNYKDVIKGKNMAQNIELQPHDTLVVP